MSKKMKELVITRSLKDLEFARGALLKLPATVFEDDKSLQTIYTVLKRQLMSSQNRPSQEVMTLKIEDLLTKQGKDDEVIDTAITTLNSLYEVEKDKKLEDESINTEVDNYVKAEMTKDAIIKAVRKNELEDVDKIGKLGEEITKIAVQNLSGGSGDFLDFFNDIDKKKELLSNIYSHKYPTGFKTLDGIIEGGLSRGEVGVISGITGGGKSLTITNLIANYVRSGLNVLLVSLEENMERIVLRSEQQMFGIKKSSILNTDYSLNEASYEAIQQLYQQKGKTFGKYFISKHKPQEVSPSKLEQIIVNTTVREDTNIDVVIIDYPELMINPYNNASESEAGSLIYEHIRKLSQEYDFLCWTISQVNRNASQNSEVITKSHIEGSKRKLNAVELHLTLNQTSEEFEAGYLRFYLDKVRNNSGRVSSKIIPMRVEPETMTVRDCLPEEIQEHSEVMNSRDSQVFNKPKQESPTSRAKSFDNGF